MSYRLNQIDHFPAGADLKVRTTEFGASDRPGALSLLLLATTRRSAVPAVRANRRTPLVFHWLSGPPRRHLNLTNIQPFSGSAQRISPTSLRRPRALCHQIALRRTIRLPRARRRLYRALSGQTIRLPAQRRSQWQPTGCSSPDCWYWPARLLPRLNRRCRPSRRRLQAARLPQRSGWPVRRRFRRMPADLRQGSQPRRGLSVTAASAREEPPARQTSDSPLAFPYQSLLPGGDFALAR